MNIWPAHERRLDQMVASPVAITPMSNLGDFATASLLPVFFESLGY